MQTGCESWLHTGLRTSDIEVFSLYELIFNILKPSGNFTYHQV
jgi:hypothetical protein